MTKLKENIDEINNVSITENGAVGYRTTGKALLDLNFAVSSMRNETEKEIIRRFYVAYNENPVYAIQWLFYVRDVREGLGERRLFRVIIKALANCKQYDAEDNITIDIVKALINSNSISEYGRWDDVLCLLDTPVKDNVISIIKSTLASDVASMKENKKITLLSKWLPSANASSKETKRYAKIIISSLGITEKEYRKTLSRMRSYIKVVEVDMSAKNWTNINYSTVPSRANLIYNNAFLRNDEERRREFLEALKSGNENVKINAGVLYPHDIVHKYINPNEFWSNYYLTETEETVEQLWKALPDMVNGNDTTLVVADGSGSMTSIIGNTSVSCLEVANALAIYFSERAKGEFKNKYITFSEKPQLVDFTGCKSLLDKIQVAIKHDECANTNIEAVFNLILTTAVNNKMTQDEMPKNILILSDMEFDSCVTMNTVDSWSLNKPTNSLFDKFKKSYEQAGYKLPRLIFWNICSRTGTIPVKENELGVALVSGFSPNIVKMIMGNSLDPYALLIEVLRSPRYESIRDIIANVYNNS